MCAGAQRKRRAAPRQRRQAAGEEEEEEDVEAEFNPENPYQVSHISDAGVNKGHGTAAALSLQI